MREGDEVLPDGPAGAAGGVGAGDGAEADEITIGETLDLATGVKAASETGSIAGVEEEVESGHAIGAEGQEEREGETEVVEEESEENIGEAALAEVLLAETTHRQPAHVRRTTEKTRRSFQMELNNQRRRRSCRLRPLLAPALLS